MTKHGSLKGMKKYSNLKGLTACVCGALFIYVTIRAILTSNGLAALQTDFELLEASQITTPSLGMPDLDIAQETHAVAMDSEVRSDLFSVDPPESHETTFTLVEEQFGEGDTTWTDTWLWFSFSKDDIPAIEIDSQRDMLTGFPSSWNDNSIVVVVDLGRPSDPESYFFELDCVLAIYIHGHLFDLTDIQTASITKRHLPMPLKEACDED